MIADKPQVLFGPWVSCSSTKGYGPIVEFPLMQAVMAESKDTEHVQITLLEEKQEESQK